MNTNETKAKLWNICVEKGIFNKVKGEDFKKIQSNFRHIDSGFNQFKIDLSGIEVVFILENTIKIEEPVKISIFGKLKSFISGKLTVKN